MLSSEARQVVVVVVAFVAGLALTWVPLSSAPLPFTDTPTYPVWGFLIAMVCGSCPIVWSHGMDRRLDPHGRLSHSRPLPEW
jgi:hypothetical protein